MVAAGYGNQMATVTDLIGQSVGAATATPSSECRARCALGSVAPMVEKDPAAILYQVGGPTCGCLRSIDLLAPSLYSWVSSRKIPGRSTALPLDILPSVCPHDCPSACALEVERIDGNRIGRIRGAASQTYTHGVVCAKVARYAERQHHPDRLPSRYAGSAKRASAVPPSHRYPGTPRLTRSPKG